MNKMPTFKQMRNSYWLHAGCILITFICMATFWVCVAIVVYSHFFGKK